MSPAEQNALLIAWIAFTAVALAGLIAAFIWAVRTGQFNDQDHARYLPLQSGTAAKAAPRAAAASADKDANPPRERRKKKR